MAHLLEMTHKITSCSLVHFMWNTLYIRQKAITQFSTDVLKFLYDHFT